MKKIFIAIISAVISVTASAGTQVPDNFRAILTMYSELAAELYTDKHDLGLSEQEMSSIKKYVYESEYEINRRCAKTDYDCRYPYFDKMYDELKAFKQQKVAEKKKRMSTRQMPSLSGSVNGQVQQPQPAKKSYMVSDEEARRRYQAGQKALNAVPEANSEEFAGD